MIGQWVCSNLQTDIMRDKIKTGNNTANLTDHTENGFSISVCMYHTFITTYCACIIKQKQYV